MMLALVTGASGSGKSEYAENLAAAWAHGKPLYYAAAMKNQGEEAAARIRRHQRQRQGKGFLTIECPYSMVDVCYSPEGTVLVECMSNLLANLMFDRGLAGAEASEEILGQLAQLRERVKHVVVVTNEIFSDGIVYDEMTEQYRAALGHMNQKGAWMADEVWEVVCAIPIQRKGERPCL